MGRVRKILVDAVIKYCLAEQIGDPVILCNDVDQVATSPGYLAAIALALNKPVAPVFVAAPVGYGYRGARAIGLPPGVQIPELYLFNRVQDAINHCTRRGLIGPGGRSTWPEGTNLAFRGSAYCSAGGFNPRVPNGEDDAMGFALSALWQNSDAAVAEERAWGEPQYEPTAWIVTDPRRVLSAICAGRTGIEAWAWQSFTENPGSGLDTASLARECAGAPWLLQAADLKHLNQTWERVTSRIGWLFSRSVVFDRRTRSLEQLKEVAAVFGLEISDGILNYEPLEFEATIDWEKSSLLEELTAIFG